MPKYFSAKGKMMLFFGMMVSHNSGETHYLIERGSSNTAMVQKAENVITNKAIVKRLFIRTDVNTINSNTVITVVKNRVDTAITITLGSGELTGNDTTHSFSVEPGDRISIKVVSGGDAGTVEFIAGGLELVI